MNDTIQKQPSAIKATAGDNKIVNISYGCKNISANSCIVEYTNIVMLKYQKIVSLMFNYLERFMQDFTLQPRVATMTFIDTSSCTLSGIIPVKLGLH